MNQPPRREFIELAGAMGAGLTAWPLVSSAAQTGNKSVRPNILVFLTDDHGQWAQHAYGNSELVTPHLDRLAVRGTVMKQTFTTCPVCSPARASFCRGRMPSQHGINDWLTAGKAPLSDAPRKTFEAVKHWKKNDPLVPSGLVGPVTLRAAEIIPAK